MAILPPSAPIGEGSAPAAICPACELPGSGHYLASIPADVPRAEYLCARGHLWITSWFAAGGGAA